MYKILIDGDPLAIDVLEDTALVSAILSLEANRAGSFEFTIAPNHPAYDSIVLHKNTIEVYQDAELLFLGTPISESTNFWNEKTVSCEGELAYLNDTVQRPAKYSGKTAATYLASLLTQHNAQADADKQFSIGAVTVNASGLDRTTNYTATLSAINDGLLSPFGGFLRCRWNNGVRHLDYLADSPRTSLQIIKIGSNLLDLAEDFDASQICTVLIPIGAQLRTQTVPGINDRVTIKTVNAGLDYIVSTASGIYGNVWKTKTFDNISDPATLKAAAQTYLTDAQWANLTIDASAFDLGLADSAVQQFRILDKIRVVSEPHGLDRYFILTKLEINLLNPGSSNITLGSKTTLSLSAQTAESTREIERDKTEIFVTAASNARQILEAATGGVVYFVYDGNGVCTEIRIMDTNDPNTATKWWRWNVNGWGYTNDGGQTYSVAATMNGEISADLITAGTLDASRVNVTNLDADNITAGKITGLEINNGSGTFRVTNAGSMTATSGQIANWAISGYRLSAGGVYISSNSGEFFINTPNMQVGHNGDLQTTGKINLINVGGGQIQENGTPIIRVTGSGVTRFGYANNAFVFGASGNSIEMVRGGTAYTITIDGNGFLKAVPQ